MLGAVAGVFAFRRVVGLGIAVPVSAGMLLGMAVFMLLPEALAQTSWTILLVSTMAGLVIFYLLERHLHLRSEVADRIHGSHVLLTPLVLAAALHAVGDGWNVAMVRCLPGDHLEVSLIAAMGLHKMSEGLALGAVFRSSAQSAPQALRAAVLCEAMTFVGAVLAAGFHYKLSHRWAGGLLAATAGSFLYLGCHALNAAWKQDGAPATLARALGGAFGVWLISLY